MPTQPTTDNLPKLIASKTVPHNQRPKSEQTLLDKWAQRSAEYLAAKIRRQK